MTSTTYFEKISFL